MAVWQVLTSAQKQAQKLISGPSPTAKIRLLSFMRTQSRFVTSLLTEHNILNRHLYIMWLIDSPLCMRCGAEEEISNHILFECEALVTLRHTYLDSFSLDPEDVRSLRPGAIWNFIEGTRLP